MPITPFIGVRISWLMLARNSDLRRADSIATSRARAELGLDPLALGDVVNHREDRGPAGEQVGVSCLDVDGGAVEAREAAL